MTVAIIMGVGLIAGVLSGLLGIGGGIVLVPALVIVLGPSMPADAAMKVALATSLATIAVTSAFAAWQQHKSGNSDYVKCRQLIAGVAVGAVVGGVTTAWVPGTTLKMIYAGFALYAGAQMLLGFQPRIKVSFTRLSAAVAGLVTGAMSSWVGIGGGNILVPYLVSTGVPIKRTSGITSPIGVVVAIFASAGYAVAAAKTGTEIDGAIGYVHVGAFAAIVSTSLIGVLGGVKLAAHVSAQSIKRVFSLLLLATGVKMSMGLLIS